MNKLKSINNNEFDFNIEEDEVSSLSPGYIIRPDGIVIKIENHEDHDDVFNKYINKYFDKEIPETLHIAKCIDVLTNGCNHILYYGIKNMDVKDIYTLHGNTTGCGYFFFPDDISGITEEQKNICKNIIDSNVSIISKREILDLRYQSINMIETLPISNLMDELTTQKIKTK